MSGLSRKIKKNNNNKDKDNNINNNKEEEEDNEDNEDNEDDNFNAVLIASKESHSAWAIGGQHRDHIIQVLLNLVSNFGVYHSPPVNKQESEEEFQEIFFKSAYALENVNGLRKFLRDMEDPITRDLMIHISKYKIMQRYIVPLFCLSLDDRTLAMPLIRLFLYLTKPISSSKAESLQRDIKRRKNKETAEASTKRIEMEQLYRTNALEQIEALISFKNSLVNEEVFEIILQYAAEPLLKESELRTEDDKKIIESVLMLISNLLAIEPYPACNISVISNAKEIQNKLILALSDEFLGIILLLCQTVMDRVNRAWNLILVEIVSQLIKNRDPKELLKARKNGPNFQAKTTTTTTITSSSSSSNQNSLNNTKVTPTGKLNDALTRERAERNAIVSCPGNRMNRFGGVFVVQSSISGNLNNSNSNNSNNNLTTSVPQIIRNPIALINPEIGRPNIQKKRTRGSTTFSKDLNSITKSSSYMSSAGAVIEQKAIYVLAEFLETFLSSGFSELVYSVKEGWRREDPMKNAEELMYFSMITSCLKYERLKIQSEFKEKYANKATSTTPWKPYLKNITQCFDRMSIMRPITSMASILDVTKHYHELVIPMDNFKELIIFLRIMLESEDTAHNDIALGALHKIFYISYTDRMDPVMTLLRAWKLERYSRQHLEVLLELVHETMKLLDVADYCFKKESEEEGIKGSKKNKKQNEPSKDTERAQYLAAALKFDPHEYFRRLVSNHTVRIYIRALEHYTSNTPQVNHYIYIFLQRMCSYRIEDDHSIKQTSNNTEISPGQVSLGHLLYNIPALSIFSKIINDKTALSDKNLEPMIKLIKNIVRRFGESVKRNHLIFVEILFPRNLLQWGKIEGVYDALNYAKGKLSTSSSSSNHNKNKFDEINVMNDNDNENDNEKQSDSESSDSAEEFDENLEALRVPVSLDSLRSKKTQRKRKSNIKRVNSNSSSDTDSSLSDSDSDIDVKKQSKRLKKINSFKPWNKNEDEVLRELYQLYAGTSRVFEAISLSSNLIDLGGERTPQQIEDRVNKLKLHLILSGEIEEVENNHSFSTKENQNDNQNENEEMELNEDNESEDEKWKRVLNLNASLSSSKNQSTPKLTKKLIRKESKKNEKDKGDDDDDDEFIELNTPLENEVNHPTIKHSVLLDSDDD